MLDRAPATFELLFVGVALGSLVGIPVGMLAAFRRGRAALIAPFKYSGMLWAVVIGYVVWGDLPDRFIWAGAAVLVASGLWIARFEHKS